MIRSREKGKYRTVMELVEHTNINTTINLIFFEPRNYYITTSDNLREYAISRVYYLQKLLNYPEYEIHTTESDSANAQPLVNMVIDEMQGLLLQAEEMTTSSWLKLILFIGAVLAVPVFIFVLKDSANAIVTAVLLALYVVFELPERLRSRRG